MQPFQCDLQPHLQETHRTTHTGTTIRCKTHIEGTKRPQPHPPHTRKNAAAATLHGKTQDFVLRLPPSNTEHATFMQPIKYILQHSLHHHFPSSPLPIVTTSLRHHFPSSPLPFVHHTLFVTTSHFPSSPLPFITTSLPHHFPSFTTLSSSPLPIVTTSLHHHFPSSPLPFVTTCLPHHFPSSPLPIVIPSSSLHFVTTPLRHHFPSSPPCVIASYSFVMYCYVMYHPSSRSIPSGKSHS